MEQNPQEIAAPADLGKAAALDALEAEANGMTPPPAATGEPAAEPAPEPVRQFSEAEYSATHEMIVGSIKMAMRGFANGEAAGAVWDSPWFKQAVIPVLKKYGITMNSLPVELVLIGVIGMLAKQTADIIKQGKKDGPQSAQTAPAAA